MHVSIAFHSVYLDVWRPSLNRRLPNPFHEPSALMWLMDEHNGIESNGTERNRSEAKRNQLEALSQHNLAAFFSRTSTIPSYWLHHFLNETDTRSTQFATWNHCQSIVNEWLTEDEDWKIYIGKMVSLIWCSTVE